MATRKAVSPFLTPVFVFLLSAFTASPVLGQATLENPAPSSFQSGIGIISGWACEASEIEIEFNNDPANRWRAGTGTQRTDTHGVCGDTDNGFGLLFNWNHLGNGLHTVRAFADGVEFANVVVTVTTLGEEFLRGTIGELSVSDFPTPGATRTLRWQQAQQNFVITNGSAGSGGGTSGSPPRILENPSPGSFQSGVGVISGWVCEASQIEIEFNNDAANRWTAGYGTQRTDTHGACGDTDNGFGLLFNWNHLGNGLHTVRAFADGVEFANVVVTVTTLGEEFARGLSHEVTVADFPHVGTDLILVWQEAQQNFVIAAALPTAQLVAVNPVVTLPDGVSIPNVAIRSLHAETAEVLARPEPSLLLAEDAGGNVLLGVANRDGGLLGEGLGDAEVSVDSTAIVLVSLSAGYSVHAIDRSVVDEIRAHPTYQALISAMSTRMAVDKNFLEHLLDHTDIIASIQEVAEAIAHPQSVRPRSVTIQRQAAGSPLASTDSDLDLRRRLLVANFAAVVANALLPTEAIQRALQVLMTRQTYESAYGSCVEARIGQRTTGGGDRALSYQELRALETFDASIIPVTLMRGIAGALRDAADVIECVPPLERSPSAALVMSAQSEIQTVGQAATRGQAWRGLEILRLRARPILRAGTGAWVVVAGASLTGGAAIIAGVGGAYLIGSALAEVIGQSNLLDLEPGGGRGSGSAAACRSCVAGGGDYDYCESGGAISDAGCVPAGNTDLHSTCRAQGKAYRYVLAGSPERCAIFE